MSETRCANDDLQNPRIGLFLLYGGGADDDVRRGDVTSVETCCDAAKQGILKLLDQQFEEWLYDSCRTVFEPRLKIEFRSVRKSQLRSAVATLSCPGAPRCPHTGLPCPGDY